MGVGCSEPTPLVGGQLRSLELNHSKNEIISTIPWNVTYITMKSYPWHTMKSYPWHEFIPHWTLTTVNWKLHYALYIQTMTMTYTLYTIKYTLHLKLYTIHFTLYTIHFKLNTTHYTLCTIHYPLYTIHFVIYTI